MKRGQAEGAAAAEREGAGSGAPVSSDDDPAAGGVARSPVVRAVGTALLGIGIAVLALGALLMLFGTQGCYSTPTPDCGFTCGANATCPDEYVCGANNRCRLPSVPEEECPGVAPAVDAGVDAPSDGRMDAPPAQVCLDLMPASDGTGRQQLLISELSPGSFIELFNPTDADLGLAQGDWGLQARAATYYLKDLATAVTVPAHGYAHFPWPAELLAGDAGGELALYTQVTAAADFDDGTKLVGYACWGSDAEIARKQLAEDSGKWAGDCAAALTMSALRRKVATTGAAAASFAVDVAVDKTACDPTP
jgi:hypothetical protein